MPISPEEMQRCLTHCAGLLRGRRKALRPKLSQGQAAALLDISRPYLGKFERGEQWLDTPILLAYAHLLALDPGQLFPTNPASPEARLLLLLSTFPPEAQAAEKLYAFLAPMRPTQVCHPHELSAR